MTAQDTETAWRIARAGDWASWRGLPADADVATVLRELAHAALSTPVATQLSRRLVDRYDASALQVWAAGRGAILIEWIDPPCADTLGALLARLGPPDHEGAGRYLRAGTTTTEYVYAARGLALTEAASYDAPPGFAPYLVAVQLFAPGSLRDFMLQLGGNDVPGPRPIGPEPR